QGQTAVAVVLLPRTASEEKKRRLRRRDQLGDGTNTICRSGRTCQWAISRNVWDIDLCTRLLLLKPRIKADIYGCHRSGRGHLIAAQECFDNAFGRPGLVVPFDV